LSVSISDVNGDTVTVTFYDASDDSVISTDSVTGSGTASVSWSGLSQETTYSWYVIANDGTDQTTSATWSFTTYVPNVAPTVANPNPGNATTGVSTSPTLSVDVSDDNGDALTVTFYDASDDSVIGTDSVTGSGTASTTWSGLTQMTTYSWKVVVDDGTDTTNGGPWSFETMDVPLTISNPVPANGTTGVEDDVAMSVDIAGGNGTVDVTFYWSGGSSFDSDTVSGSGTAFATAIDLEDFTEYSWYVVAEDDNGPVTSATWSFTTGEGWNNPGGTVGVIQSRNISIDSDGRISASASIRVVDQVANQECFSNTTLFLVVYDTETGDPVPQTLIAGGSTQYQSVNVTTGGQHTQKICDSDGTLSFAFSDFYLPENNKDYRICVYWQTTNSHPGKPSAVIAGSCNTYYYVPVMGSYGTILFILSLLGVTGIAMRRRGLSFKGGERK